MLAPERLNARPDELEALSLRHLLILCLGQVCVHRVEARVVWRVIVNLRWWIIVALTPFLDLIFAELDCGICLVKTLQRAVVALIDPPALVHVAGFVKAHLFEDQIGRLDGSVKHARVSDVKMVTLLLKLAAGLARLFPTQVVKRHIDPAGELSGLVPDRLAVPHEDHLDRCLRRGTLYNSLQWIVVNLFLLEFLLG